MNEDEESDEEEEEEEEEVEESEGRFMARRGEGVSLENTKKLGLTRESGDRIEGLEGEKELVASEMHLARGSDVNIGGGGGGNFTPRGSGGESSDRPGMEAYYKRLVEENPSNPLFLRNYAQFLYQVRNH